MVKSGQPWSGVVVCKDATGALATPSVGPAGTLYVDGVSNAASVTITGSNPYTWTVTLPTLTAGQTVSMYITATISTIATGDVVAEDEADTKRVSDLIDPPTAAQVRAEIDANSTQLAAILEDTGTTLPAAMAVVDANVDAIKLITDALDVSAVTQVAASSGGHLTITAGRTFSESVTGLSIPAAWVAAIWTLKRNAGEADAAALVQLRETNPSAGSDGLQRLNGSASLPSPLTAASGDLTVNQAGASITVKIKDEATVLLARAEGLGWDVKFIDSSGDSTGTRGTADVDLTETKAVA